MKKIVSLFLTFCLVLSSFSEIFMRKVCAADKNFIHIAIFCEDNEIAVSYAKSIQDYSNSNTYKNTDIEFSVVNVNVNEPDSQPYSGQKYDGAIIIFNADNPNLVNGIINSNKTHHHYVDIDHYLRVSTPLNGYINYILNNSILKNNIMDFITYYRNNEGYSDEKIGSLCMNLGEYVKAINSNKVLSRLNRGFVCLNSKKGDKVTYGKPIEYIVDNSSKFKKNATIINSEIKLEEEGVDNTPEKEEPEEERVDNTSEKEEPEEERVDNTSEKEEPEEERVDNTSEKEEPEEERVDNTPEKEEPKEERVDNTSEKEEPKEERVDNTSEKEEPEEERVDNTPEKEEPKEERKDIPQTAVTTEVTDKNKKKTSTSKILLKILAALGIIPLVAYGRKIYRHYKLKLS